jgi:hypothetical protein
MSLLTLLVYREGEPDVIVCTFTYDVDEDYTYTLTEAFSYDTDEDYTYDPCAND